MPSNDSLVVPTAEGRIRVELFVDQQICEAFISDESGTGFAAATFSCGCSAALGCSDGSAVVLTPVSMGGAKVEGSLSDMEGSILPPPPQVEV